jgi:hypothetical protein
VDGEVSHLDKRITVSIGLGGAGQLPRGGIRSTARTYPPVVE